MMTSAMEPHPVPQDVASFQFKLIGDMTLKQFTYLVTGMGLAYILFVFLSGRLPIIAWPLIIICSGLGAAFAFMPVGDRPLDHWTLAFIKAVSTPTQGRWKKGKLNSSSPIFASRLEQYLQQVQPVKTPILPKLSVAAQAAPLTQAMAIPTPSVAQPTPVEQPKKDLKELVETAQEAQVIQSKIVQTEHELNMIRQQAASQGEDPVAYTKQFQTVLDNLKTLTSEAQQIQASLDTLSPKPLPVKPKPVTPMHRPLVKPVALTSTANIINGIVTDAQNNYLEGVIVVAHDKEGLPVRALRTNKLGQFIAATPLPSSTYTLTLEKEGLVFDKIQISLNGTILQPITIAAKTGGPG